MRIGRKRKKRPRKSRKEATGEVARTKAKVTCENSAGWESALKTFDYVICDSIAVTRLD